MFSGDLDENSFSEARYRLFEVFVEAEPFEYLIQMVTVVQRTKEARALELGVLKYGIIWGRSQHYQMANVSIQRSSSVV